MINSITMDILKKQADIQQDIANTVLSVFDKNDIECVVDGGFNDFIMIRLVLKETQEVLVHYVYKTEQSPFTKSDSGYSINHKLYYKTEYNKKYFPDK